MAVSTRAASGVARCQHSEYVVLDAGVSLEIRDRSQMGVGTQILCGTNLSVGVSPLLPVVNSSRLR